MYKYGWFIRNAESAFCSNCQWAFLPLISCLRVDPFRVFLWPIFLCEFLAMFVAKPAQINIFPFTICFFFHFILIFLLIIYSLFSESHNLLSFSWVEKVILPTFHSSFVDRYSLDRERLLYPYDYFQKVVFH